MEFIQALTFAIAITGFPGPSEYHTESLQIRYLPLAEIERQYGTAKFAVYLRSGVILRANQCKSSGIPYIYKICASTLAHELTHWLQHINRGWPETCDLLISAERQAYRVQRQFEMKYFSYLVSGLRMPSIRCEL